MEESKFRVWDKDEKRFCYFSPLEGLDASLKRIVEEGEKQQFSGLKDVKGKEIYEGDFIKDVYDNEELDLLDDDDYDPDEPTGVVKYMHDGWVVSDGTEEGGYYLEEFINMVEVAGNVYENEEWLPTLYSPPENVEPIKIKFRVWDGQNIIYVSKNSGYRLIFEGSDWELEFKDEMHCSSIDPCCKLMQYSGATDINGKDIYEGDIVKNGLNEEEYKRKYRKDYKEYGFSLGEFKGICTYEEDSSCWVIDNPKYPSFTMVHHLFCEIDMNLVEIIGNVYKNEELFKALISE
ncbi:YopX family protein [Peribacillus sp. NJ11]|uniref:YopX family protein n=1 Tax=Peribacillus sp. NJ11 TaxID=3055861 RepID=UPI0025A26B79|nr:YopX family protein [Peribacillus sp. NJ11]MDM5223000.1 YopX family protein [Peribacillus sp. NJ11]